jgi:hypothetical protein
MIKSKKDYKGDEEKAVSFHVILLPLNYQPGSHESILFTKQLCDKEGQLNPAFDSKVVRDIL